MTGRHKLLSALVAGAFAVMVVVGHLIWSGYGEAIHVAEARTRGYAAILEARLDATLRRADAELQQLVRTTPLAALNRDAVSANAQLDVVLKSRLIHFPELAGLAIFDVNGDTLYSSHDSPLRPNIADRSHFRMVRDNPRAGSVFSEVIVARNTGRPSVTFTRALRDEQGAFRGVVAALIELEYFQILFQSLDVGAGGVVSIYRSDDFRQVLRWPAIQGQFNMALPQDSPTRAALAGGARTATVELTAIADGIVRIYSYHVLQRYPFYIAVGVARDDALASWRQRAQVTSLSTLLLVGLLCGLMYRLWRADAVRAGLAAIVENSNDAIYSRTLDGTILTWNSGAERMFGYSAAEAVGQPISIILPPGQPSNEAENNEKLLRDEVVTCEYDCITRDGRTITVLTSVSPIRDSTGKMAGASGTMQDITPLKQAQAALKDSETRLRATFEQAAVGIAHFDLQDRNLKANRRYCEITGHAPEELLGKSPGFLNHPDDLGMGSEKRVQLLSGAIDHFSQDKRYLRKDGTLVWVTRTESLARDDAGAPLYYIRVIEDITERKQAEEALRESEGRYRMLVENSPYCIHELDLQGRLTNMNRAGLKMMGVEDEYAICGMDYLQAVAQQDRARVGELLKRALQGEASAFEFLASDGRVFESSFVPVKDARDNVSRLMGLTQDITERKQSAQAQAQLAAIVETSDDAIVGRAPDDTIISWNAAAERMFGWSAADAIGQTFRHLLSLTPDVRRQGRFEKVLRGEPALSPLEDNRRCKDGSNIQVQTTMSAVRDEHGKILFVACIMRDVTERLKAERQIEQLATKDALTGLSNRNMLMQQMDAAIARATRSKSQLAVMFIDLDRFKAVNDTLGHAAGDDLLRQCAKRLTDCVRDVDIAARLGGDEFVVLLTDFTDTAVVPPISDRMLKALTAPYDLRGHDAQTSASIGICLYPGDGSDAVTLMKNADIAMYHAKELGRNNYQFYAEDMNQRMLRRQQLEHDLRAAVENNELVLHYQPQVVVATGEIRGAESLVRWQHPTRGLLQPAEFIAVAEETGLIVPMGVWILNHACRTIKAWRANGVGIPYVVVNVSAAQLGAGLVASVRQALVDHDMEPGWLMLEITETMLMERVEEAISILQRIRELGIRIAMDDFGTGYSSLSVLQRLPLDTLKIDRSFVSAIDDETDNARACAIIGAIIAIAKELHLSVVAEGVESMTQLAFLRNLGCDTYQGYLYSKPVDKVTLEARYAAPAR
jgi:diguanylate cyclase (GGDEF)-like protein/PAS domain S-box-containing protein